MSWTWQFLSEWVAHVDPFSAWRLRRYVLNGETDERDLTVNLRGWGPLHLRGLGGGDYRMFRDTFCEGFAPPVPDRCETVIDLGGNIGLATIFLARRLPNIRVHVVEPFADNVRMIEKNLQGLIRQGRCTVQQGAMWQADEMIEVLPPPLPGSYGAVRVRSGNGDNRVEGMTMETLIDRSGFERVDMVKMDVEGAEAGMFRAGSDWLHRTRALAVEFHGNARAECDFDRVVQDRGMKIADLHANGGVLAQW